MLFRKPFSPWIGVSLFVVAAVTIPLIGQVQRRLNSLPAGPTELMELLSQKEPSLYVVSVVENKPDNGIYICTQPTPPEQLFRLNRTAQGFARWKGIVFCERVGKYFIIEDFEIQSWGEHGMQIGSLLFFGDPVLLQRIRTAILGEHHA